MKNESIDRLMQYTSMFDDPEMEQYEASLMKRIASTISNKQGEVSNMASEEEPEIQKRIMENGQRFNPVKAPLQKGYKLQNNEAPPKEYNPEKEKIGIFNKLIDVFKRLIGKGTESSMIEKLQPAEGDQLISPERGIPMRPSSQPPVNPQQAVNPTVEFLRNLHKR
jgi:hypothetical protein